MFVLVFSQLIIYFVYGFILGLIEKMDFIKYKVQIKETFLKMFIYNVIFRYIFYCSINGNFLIPNIYDFIVNSILYMLTQDIIFWVIHRTIHKEPFYTIIHKQHHSSYVIHMYGLFGKYMSSGDYIMYEFLNMPLKIIFYGESIISMCLFDIIDYVMTISSHSKMFDLDGHHQLHHLHQTHNFGITQFSDYLFNTLYRKIKRI